MAVAWAGSYSSDSTPGLRICICCRCGQKKRKKRNKHRDVGKTRRQKSMFQMKVQEQNPRRELSEVDVSNLSYKEFKIMIKKMTNREFPSWYSRTVSD